MTISTEKMSIEPANNEFGLEYIAAIKADISRRIDISEENIAIFPDRSHFPENLINAFLKPGERLLSVGPNLSDLFEMVEKIGAKFFEYYETDPYLSDPDGVIDRIDDKTKMVYIGHPNRISGVLYSPKEIETILDINESLILILDETSFEYSGVTSLDLLDRYDSLLILRSFSNFGNRFGNYVIGSANLLKKIKDSSHRKINNAYLQDITEYLSHIMARQARIGTSRELMLLLSTYLRRYGISTRLNPDGSILLDPAGFHDMYRLLTQSNIPVTSLENCPGYERLLLLTIDSEINQYSIIRTVERYFSGHKRITLHRPAENKKSNEFERISSDSNSGDYKKEPVY